MAHGCARAIQNACGHPTLITSYILRLALDYVLCGVTPQGSKMRDAFVVPGLPRFFGIRCSACTSSYGTGKSSFAAARSRAACSAAQDTLPHQGSTWLGQRVFAQAHRHQRECLNGFEEEGGSNRCALPCPVGPKTERFRLAANLQPPQGSSGQGPKDNDDEREENRNRAEDKGDDEDDNDDNNFVFDGDEETLKWALRQIVDNAKRLVRTEAAAGRKITSLLEYVRVYEDLENLNDVDGISKDVPEDTKEAFKRTALGILGTLPQEGFEIQITTNREAFSKLLLSSMMTGYMYHAAEVRMRMDEKFDIFSWTMGLKPAENSSSERSEKKADNGSKDRIEKERKVVGGKVLIHGREMSAEEYIEMLESRLGLYLTDRIMLLDYMRQIGVERLVALQSDLRGEVTETMHELVRSVVGKLGGDVVGGLFSGGENIVRNRILTTLFGKSNETSDKESSGIPHYKGVSVTIVSSREYLAHLILWALAVGYRIRGIETLLQVQQSCAVRVGEEEAA
jgi:hypothetical protein